MTEFCLGRVSRRDDRDRRIGVWWRCSRSGAPTSDATRRQNALQRKASAVMLLTRGYSPAGPRWPRHAHIASGTGPGGGRLCKWRARVRHIALFLLGQFPNQPPARIAPEGWERAKARRGGARPLALPRMASLGCSGEAQAEAGRALLSSSGQRVLHCTQSLKSPRRCRSRGRQEQKCSE